MKTYKHLFQQLVNFDNLEQAYDNARKHKFNTRAVLEFEKHWHLYLVRLMRELRKRAYSPQPLRTFILRDPKTRRICVSAFRDRIVHHALVNMLQPIFEPRFIYDSYASRKGKGTLPALKRFEVFKRKVSENNTRTCFVLKADIYHYFDTVDHTVLLSIIQKRIKDEGVLWLVRTILKNYTSGTSGKGMPLGNWTSQFFANVYLNELDHFVKNTLKAKYYIRYVDDFVILHRSEQQLKVWRDQIKVFLHSLKLDLHPQKCAIIPLQRGLSFLGYRMFQYHKLVRQRNLRKIYARLADLIRFYHSRLVDAEDVFIVLQGWNAYAMHANTFQLRQRLTRMVEQNL